MNVKVKSSQSNRNPGINQQPVYQQPKSHKKAWTAAIVVLVIALVAVAGMLAWQYKGTKTSSIAVNKDQYQAVFLANGQVYFGNMSNPGADYVKLSNIYYLQVQQTGEQPTTTNPAVQPSGDAQPQVALTKLGKELHGPEDEMYISRDQVLFWENLKNGSTVVKAIKQDEAKNN